MLDKSVTKYMTITQLVDELHYSYSTLYTYLARPEFHKFKAVKRKRNKNGKYMRCRVFKFNDDFLNEWYIFLNNLKDR